MINLGGFMFVVSGSVGLAFITAYFVSKVWPPKKINDLYGYRTKRSKKSQEAWEFAQNYANQQMLTIALINLLVGVLGLFLPLADALAVILSLSIMMVTLIWLFWRTERALKNKFGE